MPQPNTKSPNLTLAGLNDPGGRAVGVATMLLALGVTLIAGLIIQRFVASSLNQALENHLVSVRDSAAQAIRQYLRAEETRCTRGASEIRELAIDLEALRRANVVGKPSEKENQTYVQLKSRLASAVDAETKSWAIVTTTGVLLASSEQTHAEMTSFNVPIRALNRVVNQQSTVSTPFIPKGGDRPMMASMALIRNDEGRSVVLCLLKSPQGAFTEILRCSDYGNTGQTLAFNQRGIVISGMRFEDQLRDFGLLPADDSVTPVLEVNLRDPEVDLPGGQRIRKSTEQLSLTRMADDATRGGKSFDLTGYRDHRGIDVIGAWEYFDDYDFGIAIEITVDEAFGPLRILRWSNAILFTLLAVSVSVVSIVAMRAARENRQATREHRLAKKLGQYRLDEQIAVGGMGTVYKATHALLMRPVAIKVLDTRPSDSNSLHRFQREVELTSRLNNPHTVSVYDYGQTQDGDFYYVMEYLDGMDLGMMVSKYGDMPVPRTLHILRQICSSIAEAHEMELVHRDIKPGNVMLTRLGGIYDVAKVLDFGLVKESSPQNANVTREGSLTGTPMYMSPEAIRNPKGVDFRSDIYSIGAVGYFLVTGKPMFDVAGTVDAILNQISEQPQQPSERAGKSIPRDFEDILLACLSKDPGERPNSVMELVSALQSCSGWDSWTQQQAADWWTDTYAGWQRSSTLLNGKDTIIPMIDGDEPPGSRLRPGSRIGSDG